MPITRVTEFFLSLPVSLPPTPPPRAILFPKPWSAPPPTPGSDKNPDRRPAAPLMTPTTPPSAGAGLCQASSAGLTAHRAGRRLPRPVPPAERAGEGGPLPGSPPCNRAGRAAPASPVPDSGSAAHPAGLCSGRCRSGVAARDAGIGPRGSSSPPAPPPVSAATSVPPPSARGAEPRPGPDGSDVTEGRPRGGPRGPRPPAWEGAARGRAGEGGSSGAAGRPR